MFLRFTKFGRLDWKVSALGFGAMRLPIIDQNPGKIDEAEAIKMMRYAFDHGVNYIDTAYPYHQGTSEVVVGKALKDGYREKVRLATKMPTWLVNSKDDMERTLNEQLTRLQVDYIDFYLLHGLDAERFGKMQNLNVFDWAEKAEEEEKIRHLGFSFHDKYDAFKRIIDGYNDWTFCQIQYNYMDAEYQAGTKGLKYAASKGLAAVVMEPIAGGLLAVKPPKDVQAIWDEAKSKRSPAEWALQWVWNQPEVSVVLSGMSTLNQVVENIGSANQSGPGKLTKMELDLISKVREKYGEYGVVGCTGCKYCQPCPQGVAIPDIFTLYNEYFMKGRNDEVVDKYGKIILPEKGLKKCVKCGLCEEQCPQKLPIRDLLTKATFVFEKPTP